MTKNISQMDLVKEFFIKNLLRDIPHKESVDWVVAEYKKRTGKVFRDPDRAIRMLSQQGFLIKQTKGVYRYEPEHMVNRTLEDFTEDQKQRIKQKGQYKCAICGLGPENGVEIHVDHIKPKDLGGKAEIANGQVLCAKHNFIKKNTGQTETGKRMFNELYKLAKSCNDTELMAFIEDIKKVYEKHNINGHIHWKDD